MPAGRPPMFTTPDDLQQKIDEYFATGVKRKKVLVGPPANRMQIEIEVPTITGLAIYLGFESRQSFYDYELKPEFAYTIKRARLFIENEYEEMLNTGNTAGAIFALKNFGWTDKQEIDQNTKISGSMTFTGIQIIRDYDHSATPGPEVQTPPDAEAGTMPPPSV